MDPLPRIDEVFAYKYKEEARDKKRKELLLEELKKRM